MCLRIGGGGGGGETGAGAGAGAGRWKRWWWRRQGDRHDRRLGAGAAPGAPRRARAVGSGAAGPAGRMRDGAGPGRAGRPRSGSGAPMVPAVPAGVRELRSDGVPSPGPRPLRARRAPGHSALCQWA